MAKPKIFSRCLFLLLFFSALYVHSQDANQHNDSQGATTILGQTQPLSPNSEQLSNNSSAQSLNSNELLATWETLSLKFNQGLTTQSMTLQQALLEIKTSKINSDRLTHLLDELSATNNDLSNTNENLKTYNTQIAERMQDRDEDLAWAYNELSSKEIAIAKRDMAIVILATLLGVIVVLVVIKFVLWIKGGAAFSLIKSVLK